MIVPLIHASILIAQVAAGLLLSSHPTVWLASYAQLCLLLCTVIPACAYAADLLYAASAAPRLQPSKPPSSQPRSAELAETLRAMVVFAGFAAWPRMQLTLGLPTALQFTLAGAQPEAPSSLALYALKLVAATFIVDAYMYFKHRALHSRALFIFHKQHHAFHNPTPFASFAVAPVEAALTFAPVLMLCVPEARVWAQAYGLWTGGFVALNLYLHAGVSVDWLEGFLRPLLLNSSEFHNLHHSSGGSRNFGELLWLWDWALGSGSHPGSEARAALESVSSGEGRPRRGRKAASKAS